MSRTMRCAAALGLAALIYAAPGAAATPIPQTLAPAAQAPAATALSIDAARDLALERSRALKRALLAAESAALVAEARESSFLPSLSASAKAGAGYGGGKSLAETLSVSIGVSASQTIYDGGKAKALAAIDAIDEASAKAAARAAYLEAVRGVEEAYYSALKAQAAWEAARADLEASRLHLDLAKAKLEAGMIARPAYLKAESEAATAQTSLDQARKASSSAQAKLASLTGLAAPLALSEEGATGAESLAARMAALSDEGAEALAAALEKAALGGPAAEKARLAVDRAEGEASSAARSWLPTVGASYSHNASYSGADGLDLLSGSLSVTASVSADWWTLRNAAAQRANAVQDAALSRDESLDSLSLDVRDAVFAAIADARAIASSRKALEYAQDNYRSQLEAFRLASLSSSELSDAEALLGSARSSLISARFSFLSGLSELRALAGLEDLALLESSLP